MERFRGLPTTMLIAIGSIVGFLAGGELGLVTDRGIGLVTIVGALLGAGAGIYIAQLIAIAPTDDES